MWWGGGISSPGVRRNVCEGSGSGSARDLVGGRRMRASAWERKSRMMPALSGGFEREARVCRASASERPKRSGESGARNSTRRATDGHRLADVVPPPERLSRACRDVWLRRWRGEFVIRVRASEDGACISADFVTLETITTCCLSHDFIPIVVCSFFSSAYFRQNCIDEFRSLERDEYVRLF